jgi:O-acetyl-ADP-ribose deacetylase (regulator of RNase III)
MPTIHGDLLKLALSGRFDVIIHGCNCQCQMGAGIAKTVKALFPEAYRADCETIKGAREKLGSISFAAIVRPSASFTIVNAYTQFHWRGSGVKADYEAIRSAMRAVGLRFDGLRIGYPLIGAGLAGGDWNIISSIIDEELDDQDHTLVVYEP